MSANGRFGEFMFFTAGQERAGAGYSYSITLDDSEIIDARQLFYHPDCVLLDGVVASLAEKFDIEIDDAEDIISERKQLRDIVDSADGEDDWDVQHLTACCAKLLGFRAVAVSDEFGTSYMIDMLGREKELVELN